MEKLEDEWAKHLEHLVPELVACGSHADRVGILMGCAASFASLAKLTESEFLEIARASWRMIEVWMPPSK